MSNKIEILAYHDGELDDEFLTDIEQVFAKFKFKTSTHEISGNAVILATPNKVDSTSVNPSPDINPETESIAPTLSLDPSGPQEFVTTLGSGESAENSTMSPEVSNIEMSAEDPQATEIPPEDSIKGKCVIRNLSSSNAVDYIVDEKEPYSKLMVSSVTPGDTIQFCFGSHVYYLPRYEGRAGVSVNTPNLLADNITRFIISLGDGGNTESFPCILEVCEFQGADSAMVIFGQDMAEYVKSNTH